MAEANLCNYEPDCEMVEEVRAETIKDQKFFNDHLVYCRSVEASKKRLEDRHRVKYGDGPPFVGPLAYHMLKPRGVGYFVEWLLQPSLRRYEFFHDTALTESQWIRWVPTEKERCLTSLGQIPNNKDFFGSVSEWAREWVNLHPDYDSTRKVLFEGRNFCHRFEYSVVINPFNNIPSGMETLVYFRDTLSTALLFGHWGTACRIAEETGGWVFNTRPLLWRTSGFEKRGVVFTTIREPSMYELSHTCCFLEGAFRDYFFLERVGPMDDACRQIQANILFPFDWSEKFRERTETPRAEEVVVRLVAEALFSQEFPPWLKEDTHRFNAERMAHEIAHLFYKWCRDHPTIGESLEWIAGGTAAAY